MMGNRSVKASRSFFRATKSTWVLIVSIFFRVIVFAGYPNLNRELYCRPEDNCNEKREVGRSEKENYFFDIEWMSGAFREAVQFNGIIAVTCEHIRQLLNYVHRIIKSYKT